MQLDTLIDTVFVYKYCKEGINCLNHRKGILDSTYYLQANVGKAKNYRKVMPHEVDSSVNCNNLYIDVFGHLFYFEEEIKQIKDSVEMPKLTSFDTIKEGTKIFPAAKPFVPRYFTHLEPAPKVKNDIEMIFDILCFNILIWATIGYIIRSFFKNSWYKLWRDIINA